MKKRCLLLIILSTLLLLVLSVSAGAVEGILVGPDGTPLDGFSNVYVIDGKPQPVYNFAEHRWYSVFVIGADENGTPLCTLSSALTTGDNQTNNGNYEEKLQKNNCFSGTTFVLMADGSSKMIKDITVGEKVMGHDPITGRFTSCEVVDNYPTAQNDYYILNGGLMVTAGHPFYATNFGPTPASLKPAPVTTIKTQDLKPYATLYGFNPAKDSGIHKLTLTSIVHVNEPGTFYNLQVDGAMNFFVSSDGIVFAKAAGKLF